MSLPPRARLSLDALRSVISLGSPPGDKGPAALILAAARSSGLYATDLAFDATKYQLFALLGVTVGGHWLNPDSARLIEALFHPKGRVRYKTAVTLIGKRAADRLDPIFTTVDGWHEYSCDDVRQLLEVRP